MLKIYGSVLCKDCLECKADLDRAGVAYTFLDFGESLENLKEFLALRDRESLFSDARKEGYIGIPCILKPDGQVTLDWEEFLQ